MTSLSTIETNGNHLEILESITYAKRLVSIIDNVLKSILTQVPATIVVIAIWTLLGVNNSFAHEGNGLHTHPAGKCSGTAWTSKHENGDEDSTGGLGNVAYDKHSNQLTITFCLPASGELREYEYAIVTSGADIVENIYAGESNTAPLNLTTDRKFYGKLDVSSDTLVNVIAKANGAGVVNFELQSDDFEVNSDRSTISHEFIFPPNSSDSSKKEINPSSEVKQEITENLYISFGFMDIITKNLNIEFLTYISHIIVFFIVILVVLIILYNGWSFGHRFWERRKKYHRTISDLNYGDSAIDEITKAFQEITKRKYENIDLCRRDCLNLLLKIIEICDNEIKYEDFFPVETRYEKMAVQDNQAVLRKKTMIKQYNDIISIFLHRIEIVKNEHPNIANFDDEKLEENEGKNNKKREENHSDL